MHFVCCAFGTVGDVGPLLKVSKSLVALGHQVTFVINPAMVDLMVDAQMPHVTVGAYWVPDVHDTRLLNPRYVWKHVFRQQVALMCQAVQEIHTKKPVDGVINHIWCFGGAYGAELLGVPWTTIALSPITWLSVHDPPQLDHRTFSPSVHRWTIKWLARPLLGKIFESDLQKEARSLGLSDKPNRFWGMYHRAHLNVAMWSTHWRTPVDDDPPNTIFAGFPKSDGRPLSPELQAWLDDGAPPVVMGLGSVLPELAEHEYEMVAQACLKRRQRVVCVGIEPQTLAHLNADPEMLYVAPWVSYRTLFPFARAVIHHGGIGSTSEALHAGVPTIVIGFGNDQHDNGRRNVMQGVGQWIPRQKLNAGKLDAALDVVLTDQVMIERARALADDLHTESPGQHTAAQAIVEAFTR